MQKKCRYLSGAILIAALLTGQFSYARGILFDGELLIRGVSPISFVSPDNIEDAAIPSPEQSSMLSTICRRIGLHFVKYKWEKDACGDVAWQMDLKSKSGHPLLFATFGGGSQTTLLLGGVHPDELTPIPIVFRMARYLAANPQLYKDQDVRIVVAPLVNPDGFLRNVASRTNANGIDLNRNFFHARLVQKSEVPMANTASQSEQTLSRLFSQY